MSDRGSIEENVTGSSTENIEGEVSEIQTLTQEAINEQVKWLIAPLSRQLKVLTRLLQGMMTTQQPEHYPKAVIGTTSGTVTHQSDRRYQ